RGNSCWFLQRLRRFSGFERIRTGPSPEDDALLQLTRELALFFDISFWYKAVLWGKFNRSATGWMISKPVLFSPGQVELMLPEFLKGKLSLENWVFEVDREVADKLGPEGILEVLDRMKSVDPKANPSTRLAHSLAFWSPSINDRVSELRNSQPITLPKRSRISRIGLRWRVTIV